jgi:hypothetical protein
MLSGAQLKWRFTARRFQLREQVTHEIFMFFIQTYTLYLANKQRRRDIHSTALMA